MRFLLAVLLVVSASACSKGGQGSLAAVIDEGLQRGYPAIGVRVEARDGRHETIARGFADLSARARLKADDRFLSFSITKVFVAVLVYQLVEEGKLGLDDKMIDLLDRSLVERIDNADVVTVRQLLNHRSGIPDIFDDPAFRAATNGRHADLTKRWTPRELIGFAYDRPAVAGPGTGSHYSNTNYDLLGLIVEKLIDKPLAMVIAERITQPLGLNDTFFAGFAEKQKDYVKGYARNSRELRDAGFDFPFPLAGKALMDVSALNYSYEWAAGGLVSSLPDLAKFARALLLGNLLKPASLKAMRSFPPDATALAIGDAVLGAGIEAIETPAGRALGHSGDGLGYSAIMYVHEADGTIVVAFANAVGLPEEAAFFSGLFAEAVAAARSPDFGEEHR